jgi:hypothetical protein
MEPKLLPKSQAFSEPVTVYTPSTSSNRQPLLSADFTIMPNPGSEFIAVQRSGLATQPVKLQLVASDGKVLQEATIEPGSSIAWFDVRTYYSGTYLLRASAENGVFTQKVILVK